MLGQRRRRCANIETALGECLVFAGHEVVSLLSQTVNTMYANLQEKCLPPKDGNFPINWCNFNPVINILAPQIYFKSFWGQIGNYYDMYITGKIKKIFSTLFSHLFVRLLSQVSHSYCSEIAQSLEIISHDF